MIKLPKIRCSYQNHRKMNYQYVCLNQLCLENGNELACLYCCEEYHQSHVDQVVAIKVILSEMGNYPQGKGYNILKILLKGIETCETYKELHTNFAEILAFRGNPHRFEELIDEELQTLQKTTSQYYKRIHERESQKEMEEKSNQMLKPYITPILSFKEGSNYTLNSPFSVTAEREELTTVFAYPTLSKFHDSIDIALKIERYTPSWLAIGLSVGQSKYEDKSPKHLLAISNGWISNRGTLQKSKLKFMGGDTVRVKWDKNLQLVQFISKKDRMAVKFQNKWSEQIYLCICTFYKGDSVSLLA